MVHDKSKELQSLNAWLDRVVPWEHLADFLLYSLKFRILYGSGGYNFCSHKLSKESSSP